MGFGPPPISPFSPFLVEGHDLPDGSPFLGSRGFFLVTTSREEAPLFREKSFRGSFPPPPGREGSFPLFPSLPRVVPFSSSFKENNQDVFSVASASEFGPPLRHRGRPPSPFFFLPRERRGPFFLVVNCDTYVRFFLSFLWMEHDETRFIRLSWGIPFRMRARSFFFLFPFFPSPAIVCAFSPLSAGWGMLPSPPRIETPFLSSPRRWRHSPLFPFGDPAVLRPPRFSLHHHRGLFSFPHEEVEHLFLFTLGDEKLASFPFF